MADQKRLSIENLQTAMLQNNTKMKAWVTEQLSNFKTITIEWVDALPSTDISTSTIYLLRNENSTDDNNIYDEYVYNSVSGWEVIGQVDVSNVTLKNYSDEEMLTMVAEIWSE